ncbi:hypothetical protein ABIB57_005083 [Devosia sp. UYZn731]|uniref:DUF1801 domain-containing protein n=1 Tax=Devosia sp. UYZn731 TaxID=3156345 RepID=UPI0033965CA9
MTAPQVPLYIVKAVSRYPEPVRVRLLEIRKIIFATAAEADGVGALTETLKWGEPAYLTEASQSGTTIRLGATRSNAAECAVLFNCKTTLVETFRSHFAATFAFEGNRALVLPVTGPLALEPLMLCLRAALTYHLLKNTAFLP